MCLSNTPTSTVSTSFLAESTQSQTPQAVANEAVHQPGMTITHADVHFKYVGSWILQAGEGHM